MGHHLTQAASHLSIAEMKNRMQTDPRAWVRQRWWIVYNALIAPRHVKEIALHTAVSTATVYQMISTYNHLGPAAPETPGKGGRRHQYLTPEEVEQFLTPFFAQAEHGKIATVAQIHCAFEERGGHPVDDSTIYRLLHRHGWRKCIPRPKHPKTDPHTQEQFTSTFAAQVNAAVATQTPDDEHPVLILACFGRISRPKRCWAPSGVRPHVSAQVCLCLCRCGASPGSDGLVDFARSIHRDDESLPGEGQPSLFHTLHCHASRWGWLAPGA